MNNGWIKLHRSVMDHPDYLAEPFTKMQAWLDLLLLANHKQGRLYVRGNQVDVKRGQVGWSEVELAKRWGWSKNKLRRFVSRLVSNQQVDQQKSFVMNLITIKNYELYQQNEPADETAGGPAERQQKDTNKKNKKNKKNNTQAFEAFWKAYPKKKNKGQAEKAFEKVGVGIDVLLEAVKKGEKTPEWEKEGGKYIPYPATWLNAKGWKDEDNAKGGDFYANLPKL